MTLLFDLLNWKLAQRLLLSWKCSHHFFYAFCSRGTDMQKDRQTDGRTDGQNPQQGC